MFSYSHRHETRTYTKTANESLLPTATGPGKDNLERQTNHSHTISAKCQKEAVVWLLPTPAKAEWGAQTHRLPGGALILSQKAE